MFWLDLFRFGVGVAAYGVATVFDVKTRKVPNYLWVMLSLIAGIAFAAGFMYYSGLALGIALLTVLITSLVCFAGFTFHLWGGADAKAVMCLTLLVPGLFPINGMYLPLSSLIALIALGVSPILAMWKAEKYKPFMPSLFISYVIIVGLVVL